MEDIASTGKAFPAYAASKCAVGYGIVNGIVNAGVFAAMHAGDPGARFAFGDIVVDLALTGAILGVILFAIVAPLTKHDLKAGRFERPAETPLAGRIVPRAYVGALAVVGFVSAVLAACAGAALAGVVGLAAPLPLSFGAMLALKGCVCALVGACAGYLTICFAARG